MALTREKEIAQGVVDASRRFIEKCVDHRVAQAQRELAELLMAVERKLNERGDSALLKRLEALEQRLAKLERE